MDRYEYWGANYSVITPRKLVVTPDYAGKISYGNPFPANVGYSVTGFVTGEGMEVLDTDGWKVVSNGSAFEGEYVQGTSGEGQYKTHLEGVDASDVHNANYILVTQPGLLDVEKIAMEIGEVPQGPHLDPENLDQDTGVDRRPRGCRYGEGPSGLQAETERRHAHGGLYDTEARAGDLVRCDDWCFVLLRVGGRYGIISSERQGLNMEEAPEKINL